jgi:hypothetical protein
MAGIEFVDIVKDENGINDLLLLRSQTLGLLSAFVIELSQSSINPNYALGMHSLPSGLMIRLRRMSRLNLVTLSVRVRHLSSDLTMKITNLVFLLGAKSLIFIRQLCNRISIA